LRLTQREREGKKERGRERGNEGERNKKKEREREREGHTHKNTHKHTDMHRHRDIETHRRREGDPGVTPSRGRRRPLSSTVLSSTPYISRPCITFSGVALPGPLQHTKSKVEEKNTIKNKLIESKYTRVPQST